MYDKYYMEQKVSDLWTGILACAVFAGAAYLLGPDFYSAVSDDRENLYFVDVSKCDPKPSFSERCVTTLSEIQYAIDKINRLVITKMEISSEVRDRLNPEELAYAARIDANLGVLDGCTIFDKDNWACGSTKVVEGRVEGRIVSFGADNGRQVPGWSYRLVGLGFPLLSY